MKHWLLTLQLYLLRHGIAEQKASTGRDSDRRLTAAGIAGLHRVLDRAGTATVDVIVSSPYARAIETARIAAARWGHQGDLMQSSALRPDAAPEELWCEVRGLEGAVLVVSHEPLLSAAVAWMVGETGVVFSFAPGTLVRVDFKALGRQPRGILQWKFDA